MPLNPSTVNSLQRMAISPQALKRVRRRKKARRLWKKSPLFAYETLKGDSPDYSYTEFWYDLHRTTKPKREKKSKNPLVRYGRWREIERLIQTYDMSGEVAHLIQAQLLRKYLTSPYRLLVRYGSTEKEYVFRATVDYNSIKRLSALVKQCGSLAEYETRMRSITQYLEVGG